MISHSSFVFVQEPLVFFSWAINTVQEDIEEAGPLFPWWLYSEEEPSYARSEVTYLESIDISDVNTSF